MAATDAFPLATIGFLGAGIMALPMARNCMAKGFAVHAHNRTKSNAEPLLQSGAAWAETPAALLERCQAVVVMLTGPEAIEAMMDGPHGLLAGPCQGKIIIQMSTVAPAYTNTLAQRVGAAGAILVDAPVSGSKKPAEDGTLVILAGGEKAHIDAVAPALLAMGKQVVHCGPVGAGSMMKMSINLLLGAVCAGLAEMLAFGEAGGLTVETMLEVALAGAVACPMFQLKAPMLKSGEYPPQFPLKHMTKDLKFAVDTAYETGANAPATHLMLQLYRQAVAQGLGDEDFAAVRKVLG